MIKNTQIKIDDIDYVITYSKSMYWFLILTTLVNNQLIKWTYLDYTKATATERFIDKIKKEIWY